MILEQFANGVDQLNERVGRSAAWLTTALVLLICFDVVLRYLFQDTATWVIEMEWHLFALIFLLGGGYAFKHNKHVRVDLFYSNFSARDQALVNLVGNMILLVPWCLVVLYFSFNYAVLSFDIGEGSPDPGGLPARYLIKFSITVGVALLLLQALANAARSFLLLRVQND